MEKVQDDLDQEREVKNCGISVMKDPENLKPFLCGIILLGFFQVFLQEPPNSSLHWCSVSDSVKIIL